MVKDTDKDKQRQSRSMRRELVGERANDLILLHANESLFRLTSKFTVESLSLLSKLLLASGADWWIIHSSDSHWFRLSESPTNMILFPLHLLKKSNPSNLHQRANQDSVILEYLYNKIGVWSGGENAYLGKSQESGFQVYLRYCLSGLPNFWQSNSASMKGQLEAS